MGIPVSSQLFEAAASLLLGLAAGFLYDFFRVIRRKTGSKAVTQALDLLFWLIAGAALFLLGMSAGRGYQRLFMSVIAVLGAVLYFNALSSAALFLCEKLLFIITLIIRIILLPFAVCIRALKKIMEVVKKAFQYKSKWYTMTLRSVPVRPSRSFERSNRTGKGEEHETKAGRYNYENSSVRVNSLRGGEPRKSAGANRRGRG